MRLRLEVGNFLGWLFSMLRLPYLVHLDGQLKAARKKAHNRLREIHELRRRLVRVSQGHERSLARGTEAERWHQQRIAFRLLEQFREEGHGPKVGD